jgi:hypothetical protein
LLIPLLAAFLAALWGRWAAHNRTTGDGASLAGYERFRQAMQNNAVPPPGLRPLPAPQSPQVPPAPQKPLGERPPAGGDEESPHGPVAGPVP